MEIKCFKNYGVTGHELSPVYTLYAHGDTYDEITIDIPNACMSADGYHYLIDLNGMTFEIQEIMHTTKDGEPIMVWADEHMDTHYMRVKVVA